jgi:hypothetical protein
MKTKRIIFKILYWTAVFLLTGIIFVYKILPLAILVTILVFAYPFIIGEWKKEMLKEQKEKEDGVETKSSE